ncbi:hypothetical protein K9M79_03360 [Candidatus Woesearchaeota archaeon]|nr:hypothetical protein [Candidatus Woesearchaeota archaeon]
MSVKKNCNDTIRRSIIDDRKNKSDQDRTKALWRNAPEIFKYKTVLYIGARTDRFDYSEFFKEEFYDITVLEAYEPNCEYLKNIPWIKKVICADVRTFSSKKKYDIVFWWHGPEHIDIKDLKKTLDNLETMCTKMVVLGCPWGEYKQNDLYGNPYEKHLSAFKPSDFEKLGYKTICTGVPNEKGSNITAVKRKEAAWSSPPKK